jgi:iron(III) transport system substrate-binding protein
MRPSIMVLGLLLAMTLGAGAAGAPVDDPQLIARAKAEGALWYYASLSESQVAAIVSRFESAYGIKVSYLRGSPLSLLSRVVAEQTAGHNAADVMDDAGLEMDQMKRQGLLQPFLAPETKELLPAAVDRGGYWAGIFLNTEVIAFNPGRLKALGLKPPTGWESLASREWRNNFGIPSESYEWMDALTKFYGKDRADGLVRNYAANQPQLTSSHTLAVNSVVTGELPAAANVYGYYVLDQKESGKPVDFINPTPTIVEVQCIGILKTAPHPNAARLFVRWYLSRDTQSWIKDQLHRISARKDVRNDPRLLDPKVRYVFSNPDDSPNAANVVKAFKTLFNIPG